MQCGRTRGRRGLCGRSRRAQRPGQRELIGKFGPERFEDLIIDISLFRPGPVKSDMIRPFLERRQGWSRPEHLHPTLVPALGETEGVVVFHEQVLKIVSETTGVSLAQADEVRRAMGSPQGQLEVEAWWPWGLPMATPGQTSSASGRC